MTLSIHAGWNFEVINTASMDMTDVGGSFTVTVSTGKYCHVDIRTPLGGSDYDDFATALETAINAASASSGYTVTFDSSALTYTLSKGDAFTLDFTPANSGIIMRRILGFAADTQGSATSHTSDVTPYYVIDTTGGCRSKDTKVYEPDGVVRGGHTLGGSHFAVAASNPIQFWDWELMYEPIALTFIRSAPDGTTVADVPWTYQHFWEHVRSTEPFLMLDSVAANDDSVNVLRPSGASFNETVRRPDQPDYHTYWHMKFETFLKGYL